jgi:hypothetical protein
VFQTGEGSDNITRCEEVIIIVNLDVFEDRTTVLSLGFKTIPERKTFTFQSAEEGLSLSIIIAVA